MQVLALTESLGRGMGYAVLERSNDAVSEQLILVAICSTSTSSLEMREELELGLELLGDICGALKFLFASIEAKPSIVKENTNYMALTQKNQKKPKCKGYEHMAIC